MTSPARTAAALPAISATAVHVLRAMRKHPEKEVFSGDVMQTARVASGTAYALLYRLEAHGYLQSRIEQGDARRLRRPLRRYYSFTKKGLQAMDKLLKNDATETPQASNGSAHVVHEIAQNTALYIGGPMHEQTVSRSAGYWRHYRDDKGNGLRREQAQRLYDLQRSGSKIGFYRLVLARGCSYYVWSDIEV